MIDRREVLKLGGVLGGLVAGDATAADAVAVGAGEMSDKSAQDIVNGLRAISAAVYAAQSFDAINPIRLRQNDHLKANGKFPDFIDIGLDVWGAVYDWHVRMQQPLVLGRDPAGRYTMLLGFTQLVLRPDVTPGFVSVPYDAR
jgi:hypothetical protein